MRVVRHAVDAQHASELLAMYRRQASLWSKVIESRGDLLSLMVDRGVAHAGVAAVVAPDGAEVAGVARVGARAGAALFSLARAGGRAILVRLYDDAPRVLSGTPDESSVHVVRWLTAMWTALAVGERETLPLLCAVPPAVWRASSTQSDPFVDALARALREYAAGGDEVEGPLMEALQGSAPEALRNVDPDWALDVAVPIIEVFFALLDGDAAAFDKALEKALRLHARYWGEGERARDPEGWVSMPLAALVREARARGLPARLASDYLPPALLDAPASPAVLVGCPYCLSPIVEGADVCAACLSDPRNDAPVELSGRERRARCPHCGFPRLALAVICPSCRTRR
jgi:hypothetical protein